MTVIGRSVVITGEVVSRDDLAIAGTVNGQISAPGASLIIEETGHVEADLRADRIVVHGFVRGTIAAVTRIELGATCSVEGRLSADRIEIVEGARFNGHLDMGRRTIAAKVAEYRASHGTPGHVAEPAGDAAPTRR